MSDLNITTYNKILTRDFSLPWLQMWYTGEAKGAKPWNNQKNKSLPYIVFVRRDDTVMSYYDPKGLYWQRNTSLTQIKNNPDFQKIIVAEVKEQLKPIQTLLKKHVLYKKEDLLNLFQLFLHAYPWLLAMWDATSDDELTGTTDVALIRKYRVSINTFNDDLDNIINQSLKVIYPSIANYTHVLTMQEIRSEIIPKLIILQKRDKGFIYTDDKLFELEELNKIENYYKIKLQQDYVTDKTKILKGDIACMGYAKGKVKRVMGLKNIADFKEGEILVTPMTMPDFLPAMKKAAAFITDEGGITCHAAILARELKKPCIVGTGIATNILKNGDFVEVDANKGIITLLEETISINPSG